MTRFLSCLKTALAAVAVSGMSVSAYAAESVDLGDLVEGEVYEIPSMATVTARFTPTATGPVRFLYSKDMLSLYPSAECEDGSEIQASFSYVEGGKMRTYSELTGGTTYYLKGFPLDSGTLQVFEGTSELEVTSVSPSLGEGEYFSVSSNYTIDVAFNTPVTVGKALVIVGEERSYVTASVSNSFITCEVAAPVMELYRQGAIKKGDIMTLRILQVADALDEENKYGDNGKLEIEFLMPDKPGELVEIVNASQKNLDNPFNSYYAVGDESGIISFVFDTPLASEGSVASITYGNPDNIDVGIYSEDVAGVNSDCTAEFNFCGKLRRPIDMLPASTPDTQPSGLHILFGNIRTADGQRVYTGSNANPSGYSVSFKINTLQYTFTSDYTPGRGSNLVPGTEMEIWVMNGAFVHSSGIAFDYTSNGAPSRTVVPMSEIKVEADPVAEEDMIYTFTIPELAADEGSKVKVSFADVECGDGLDHSDELSAEFGYASAGINDVEVGQPKDKVTVFNAAGVRLIDNGSRDMLKTLPKGLYIVNGKKMIIK